MNNLSLPQIVTTPWDNEWYRPGQSLVLFHTSEAFVRFIIGGRGSGKTTSGAVECIGHCLHVPGARVMCLRKTEMSQADTTIHTFNDTYKNMGPLYQETKTSLFRSWNNGRTVRLPSLEAIKKFEEFKTKNNPSPSAITTWLDTEANKWCSFIVFRGLPDAAKAKNRLRGFECSMLYFVEGDLMTFEDFNMAFACLRWKDAFGNKIKDYNVVVDTNPPGPDHWIAKLEREHEHGQWPNYRWWHICTEENRHNLPPNYIESTILEPYKNNPAMIERMYYGRYANAFDGTPVLYAFSSADHGFDHLDWPNGARLILGWDYGACHATVFSAYFSLGGVEYWWDLYEYYAEMSDTERQCDAVHTILKTIFDGIYNNRAVCEGLYVYCDPAGASRTDKGRSVDILYSNGFKNVGWDKGYRSLDKTLAVYNRLLLEKNPRGQLVYRIDRRGCPRLYEASRGGYRYPKEGEPGYGTGEPLKGPAGGNYDHIVDAARYAKINCLSLAKREDRVTILPPNSTEAKKKKTINPSRGWF